MVVAAPSTQVVIVVQVVVDASSWQVAGWWSWPRRRRGMKHDTCPLLHISELPCDSVFGFKPNADRSGHEQQYGNDDRVNGRGCGVLVMVISVGNYECWCCGPDERHRHRPQRWGALSVCTGREQVWISAPAGLPMQSTT